MLDKLRYKLTVICATITAMVLMITVISTFMVTKKQLEYNSRHTLNTELNSLIYYLQNNTSTSTKTHTLSHTWLNQLEFNNNMILYIENNHVPLHFKGNYPTKTNRDELINTAINTAITKYNFNFYSYSTPEDTLHSTLFDLKLSMSEHYLVAVSSIPLQHSTCQIVILKDLKEDDLRIYHQLLLYLLFFFMGTVLLTLFSFWFAGHAINPIIENDKKQKNFIAAASHELRSPLAVFETNLSALGCEYPNITASSFYNATKNECKRMSKLVSDLLLLSHADTHSNWSLDLHLIEADTLLLEIYDTFYLQVSKKQHLLKLELPNTPIPPCLLDSERLTQVLGIFIHNAISYTPSNSIITLALSYNPNELHISVIDNGPGIPDENKAHVFERFYRIDSSRHQKEHSGLGLSIAQEIISLHGGTILLTNTKPHGCTFTICLPIKHS